MTALDLFLASVALILLAVILCLAVVQLMDSTLEN